MYGRSGRGLRTSDPKPQTKIWRKEKIANNKKNLITSGISGISVLEKNLKLEFPAAFKTEKKTPRNRNLGKNAGWKESEGNEAPAVATKSTISNRHRTTFRTPRRGAHTPTPMEWIAASRICAATSSSTMSEKSAVAAFSRTPILRITRAYYMLSTTTLAISGKCQPYLPKGIGRASWVSPPSRLGRPRTGENPSLDNSQFTINGHQNK